MHVAEVLDRVAAAGVTLTYSAEGDRLVARPTASVTPEMVEALRERRAEVVNALREDEEMRRTGIVQSERQVFDLAREYFGGGVRDDHRGDDHRGRDGRQHRVADRHDEGGLVD